VSTSEHPVGTDPRQAAPDPTPPPTVRARLGRDLGAAIAVGVGLGAVVLASLLLYPPGFVVVVAVAIVIGAVEFVRAVETVGARPPVVPLVLGCVSILALTWYRGQDGLIVGFMITVLVCVLWRLADGAGGYLRDISTTVFIVAYLPLLAGFAVLLVQPADGPARVIAFIVTVVCSDVGGYAAGVLRGRHLLAPSVSPKKSWEGLAGSVVAAMVGGVLLLTLALAGTWWQGAVFGLAAAAAATLGDLGESLVKRDLGVKDMGSILPGHGGLMDRLDSLLPAAAVSWILLSFFLPVG